MRTSIFARRRLSENIPALMGLLGVFHRNALGRAIHAVIPYDQRLARFPAYLQQLDMEFERQIRAARRLEGRDRDGSHHVRRAGDQ